MEQVIGGVHLPAEERANDIECKGQGWPLWNSLGRRATLRAGRCLWSRSSGGIISGLRRGAAALLRRRARGVNAETRQRQIGKAEGYQLRRLDAPGRRQIYRRAG